MFWVLQEQFGNLSAGMVAWPFEVPHLLAQLLVKEFVLELSQIEMHYIRIASAILHPGYRTLDIMLAA